MRLAIAAVMTAICSCASAEPLDLSGFYVGGQYFQGTSTSHYPTEFTGENLKYNNPSLGAVAGYNWTYDGWVYGFEVAGRTQPSKDNWEQRIYRETPYPQVVGSVSGSSVPRSGSEFTTQPGGEAVQSLNMSNYRRELAAGTVSFRAGRQIGNLVLFGKVGLGVAATKTWGNGNNDGFIECEQTQLRTDYSPLGDHYGQGTVYQIGCIGPKPAKPMRWSYRETTLDPVGTVGFGAEYHFDRMFTRVEVEGRRVFAERDFDILQGGLTIGYRF